MQLTNNLGLPAPIINALKAHEHRGADYSASGLSRPVRQHWLMRRHDAELSEDASDRIWALMGSAVHYIIEKGGVDGYLQECYLEAKVGEVTLSGMFDLFDGHKISDVKNGSVWSAKNKTALPDWTLQQNVYAHLLRASGFKPEALEIIFICRDWSKREAERDQGYPQCQVQVIPLELWPENKAKLEIEFRVAAFEAHKGTPDDSLPECTDEDRWAKPPRYAVMKPGRKSALRVFDSLADADALALATDKATIQARPGEWVRCKHYCACATKCNQYKKYLQEGNDVSVD